MQTLSTELGVEKVRLDQVLRVLLSDEVMAPSGLCVTQFNLLAELARRDSAAPTVRELAEILTMERSALGQTLRPLERDGLLELGRDKRDARRRPVRLTRPGHQALTRARRCWAEAHRRFTAFFGDQALTELRATLRGIAEDSRGAFFSFAKEPTHDEP